MFLSKILRAADHPYLSGKGGRKVEIIPFRSHKARSKYFRTNLHVQVALVKLMYTYFFDKKVNMSTILIQSDQ